MITIMSFNVQHFRNFLTGEICFDDFAEEIRKYDADIIGLNEVRGALSVDPDPEYQDQARIMAEKLGYYYYFAPAILIPGKGPYGNALLSRFPIEEAETVMVSDTVPRKYDGYYEARCLLKAKTGGFNVRVIHLGLNPDEQTQAMETVLSNIPNERGILMGDFNMEPAELVSDTVGEEPFRGFELPEHMVDTAEKFTEPYLSFPSDQPEIKIDYMFVTKDLESLVKEAFIPADVVSDHRPYVVRLDA